MNSAVLSRKGLTEALSGRGRAAAGGLGGGRGQGLCGRARAVLTQRRFPRSLVEASRLSPWGWGVGHFEGRRHLRAFRGFTALEAVDRSQPPGAPGRKASPSWAGTSGQRQPGDHPATPRPSCPRSPGRWLEGRGSSADRILNLGELSLVNPILPVVIV